MKYFLFLLVLLPTASFRPSDQTALTDAEKKTVVDRHNYWRRDVGVTEKLVWSDELARSAAKWARALKRKGCGFEHSGYKGLGENLFKGTSGYFDARYVVDAWGNEKSDYNYAKNTCKPGKMCGHYTQIVWKTTKRVGCAKITCNGMDIWVCHYDPPGNWIGEKPY